MTKSIECLIYLQHMAVASGTHQFTLYIYYNTYVWGSTPGLKETSKPLANLRSPILAVGYSHEWDEMAAAGTSGWRLLMANGSQCYGGVEAPP